MIPGTVYDTGVGTVGGRGQQATVPYPDPQHILTMTRTYTDIHEDHHVTADEAIAERIARLKEMRIPYTRDGMTLRYRDFYNAEITLTYEEGSRP